MVKTEPKEIWNEYQKAREYKENIDLFNTVRKNENFYVGKQWEGVNAPDLPKPILNFLKRVVNYCAASIVSDDIAVSISPKMEDEGMAAVSKGIAKRIEDVFEAQKVGAKNRSALRDALVDGDACMFIRFDMGIETGQDAKGDIACELVENINVCFGNPYQADAQKQPYIIIAKRMTVGEIKAEAKANGASEMDISSIRADSDDVQGEQGDSDLATELIKLWRDDDTIHCIVVTETATIRKKWDTGYTLYPIAWLNWERIKSSYHGQAILTGLIPNQIHVNRLFAMTIRSVEMNAFPKVVYDPSKIKRWTNQVGGTIEAVGGVGGISDAFTSIRGADVSSQVMEVINQAVSMTRDFMGASDAALGNVKPDNTSAIIAVQQASAVPLELNRLAFYQFVEDYVRVMMDIMRADYGKRTLELDIEDAPTETTEIEPGLLIEKPITQVEFDFSTLDNVNYSLNVDIGASSYWSELMQLQTMDNLFAKGLITDATTYLESVPQKYLRNKNRIIDNLRRAQEQAAQQMPGQMPGQEQIPPEMMAALQNQI